MRRGKQQNVAESYTVRTDRLIVVGVIKSLRITWAERVRRTGEKMNAYKVLVGRPGGRRPLGRSTNNLVDNIEANIKIELKEIIWKNVEWIHLALCRDGLL
jgi:hypothetical protein